MTRLPTDLTDALSVYAVGCSDKLVLIHPYQLRPPFQLSVFLSTYEFSTTSQ